MTINTLKNTALGQIIICSSLLNDYFSVFMKTRRSAYLSNYAMRAFLKLWKT